MNSNPIGVFDSGIGGLTVVKEIIKQLPGESIIYIGDTARVPYGTRGKETITRFSSQLVNFLLQRKVKMLVVACNTISSTCLDLIEYISPVPVLGVIKPAAILARNSTRTNVVGVIGTQATINTKAYEKNLGRKIKTVSKSCPLFVPLAEEGLIDNPATEMIAKEYLKDFKTSDIDLLILGCTHYPVLKKIIQKVVGKKTTLIDSAGPTAIKLKEILEKKNLLNGSVRQNYQFYITDAPKRVNEVANVLFEGKLPAPLELVSL